MDERDRPIGRGRGRGRSRGLKSGGFTTAGATQRLQPRSYGRSATENKDVEDPSALGAVGGREIRHPFKKAQNELRQSVNGSNSHDSRRSVPLQSLRGRGPVRGYQDSKNKTSDECKTKKNHALGNMSRSGRGGGRGGCLPRTSHSSNLLAGSSITIRTLNSWADDKDSEGVLMQISNRIESVENVLMSDSLDADCYECLVRVFVKIMECQAQSIKLTRALQMLASSHFLTHLLTAFLDSKLERGITWPGADEFFKSMLKIIQQIVKYLPEKAQNCNSVLKDLQRAAKRIIILYPASRNMDLHDSIVKVISIVKETHEIWLKKQTDKRFYRPSLDSETPPEDFRELSVIPTGPDLSRDAHPFVRAIITKGAYRDQEHYLDVLFRLMREDFVKPLRNGIQHYREQGHDRKFKSSDIRLYHNAHFTGMTHTKGIEHVVQFDVSSMRHVKWDHSKRLLNGNLLCLSNDNFESTLIFATVSFRDTKLLRKGIINIECHSGLDIVLKTSPMDVFVMAETTAYYEAVNPILKGLQTINSDLPFKDNIISGHTRLRPPSYLLKDVRKYDISCLMKNSQTTTEVSVLNPMTWPLSGSMNLNPSQRDAAILALTKEISIIQGPPGTGKTYVGLKIMQVLLENQDRMVANVKDGGDPILVICFTNHALDQFLEGILNFCPKGILRVGGKSSSDRLEEFNLRNVKKKRRQMPWAWNKEIKRLRGNLNTCSKEIEGVKNSLDSLTTDIKGEKALLNFIAPKHFDSLYRKPREANRKSLIHQWLNAPNNSLMESLPKMIKEQMIRLVMKCLQLMKPEDHDLLSRKGQPIIDRVRIYQSWLQVYQYWLVERLEASKHWDVADAHFYSSLYHKSRRPVILNDSELCYVLPAHIFDALVGQIGVSENKDHVIGTWLLGLQHQCSKQLDDVEQLIKFIHRFGCPEDEDEDDFDDEEESKNAVKQRQYFEDEDEEKQSFDATLKVTSEGSFLLHRAKSLGICENTEGFHREDALDDDGFQTVTYKRPYTIMQVERILTSERHPQKDEDEEHAIDDVWRLNVHDRFSLYKLWMYRYKEHIVGQMEILIQKHNELKQELAETRMKEDVDIMRRARVIGMTTTGAAKKKKWLDSLGCRIVVVEEAAEVLEAHIVTALNRKCQHLILIGDHKQLRPNPTVYEHAKSFGLDVSLFERLVNNEIPHVTLNEQHRMRESISVIMKHIYPSLRDHVSVKSYGNIQGVSKNIYFIQHENEEQVVKDSHSKSNPFEAAYLIRLCNHFLLQGYAPTQITILATYGGQVLALKKEIEKQNLKQKDGTVRVSTVDNFQGEENDIILLSLVRSNKQSVTGFLKVDNRVCVALSRAKKGMFAIGNLTLLASQSQLWEKIKQTAELEGITGDGLPISCPNHPDEKNVFKVPEDFDLSPEGGCLKKCDFRLDCGHTCKLTCHGYNPEHTDIKCFAPCIKRCPEGHPCQKKCWKDCGACLVQVTKKIEACGHSNFFDCSKIPEDTDCICQCETVLSCGHRCRGLCGDCKMNTNHRRCEIPMTYLWPCGHAVEVSCYFTPEENPCPKLCGKVLDCGHQCPGKCSDCLEGVIHLACTAECNQVLFCGHRCQGHCGAPCPPCSRPCPVACRHGQCTQECGEPCIPCEKPCFNKCEHRKCTRVCHEKCDVLPCSVPCLRTVPKCSHQCSAKCGEICVCRDCHKLSNVGRSQSNTTNKSKLKTIQQSTVTLKLPSCGHIFNLDEIDEHVKSEGDKMSTEFICCPVCSTPIQKCNRYESALKENTQRRERKKEETGVYIMSLSQKKLFGQNVTKLRDTDKKGVFKRLWRDDYCSFTSSNEFIAMSSKVNFAYILSVITSLKQGGVASDTGAEESVEKRITALLKTGSHMTQQQIKEYQVDLKRFFLYEYSRVLKGMADSLNVELSEDLTKEYQCSIEGLKTPKPESRILELGSQVVQQLENAIDNGSPDCANPTEELGRLKKLSEEALGVLDSDHSI